MVLLIAGTSFCGLTKPSAAWGQQPPALRPVPKMGFESAARATQQHDPQHDGWDLKWRRSGNLTSPKSDSVDHVLAGRDPFADAGTSSESDALIRKPRVAPVAYAEKQLVVASGPVAQTAWTQPQQSDGFQLPAPAASGNPPNTALPVGPQGSMRGETDFFNNPFGEGSSGRQVAPSLNPNQGIADPARATEQRSMNELRSGIGGNLSPPTQLQPLPKPIEDGPSLGDMMREQPPKPRGREQGLETLPDPRDEPSGSASDRPEPYENPWDSVRDRNQVRDDERMAAGGADSEGAGIYGSGEDQLKPDMGLTCDDFRDRIAAQTIDKVSLDISPPFRPDLISEAEYQKSKADFDEGQIDRQWRSIDGRSLAKGRLVDLAYEKAVITTSYGTTEEVPINELSEPDLAYISENWGLPKECLIEQVVYTPRSWQPMTMTWAASNLCHKPLYFEDVNLERYGHTHGPLWEPVVSSAHFFVNIAVLPYKMGVHSPHECQYALGYYRPGNCAPWIKPPVPISVRGGLTQAAVMTGAFWLVP
ncbi:hypothetical protein [Novipirellula artificiosorum]|uniref:SLA1 homology domain-containing protein n=1 Tax=Novipirellula artificiosorum TaxID=2528016 RepID=A0A5C6DCM3_9BACT|nr:hypothetical protein [Novipirellula artificiosorum]TWU34973.1 hypothetical protein Poly41_41170 [Novipirellula artificiosorum]